MKKIIKTITIYSVLTFALIVPTMATTNPTNVQPTLDNISVAIQENQIQFKDNEDIIVFLFSNGKILLNGQEESMNVKDGFLIIEESYIRDTLNNQTGKFVFMLPAQAEQSMSQDNAIIDNGIVEKVTFDELLEKTKDILDTIVKDEDEVNAEKLELLVGEIREIDNIFSSQISDKISEDIVSCFSSTLYYLKNATNSKYTGDMYGHYKHYLNDVYFQMDRLETINRE